MSPSLPPMVTARPRARADREGWLVVTALFVPLVLLIAVIVMTWRAERRLSAVTARVVHEYATIAVWQYARKAHLALHDSTMRALSEPLGAHMRVGPQGPLAAPAELLAGRDSTSPLLLREASHAFVYDGAGDRILTAGAPETAGMVSMLRRALRDASQDTRFGAEPHRVLFESADGGSHAIALSFVRRPGDPVSRAFGLVIDTRHLAPLFSDAIRNGELLPGIQGRRLLDSADVALRLSRPDGAVVYASPQPLGSTAASDTTGLQEGALRVTLDLPPSLARELLVGGTPRSQLPALGLMLLVSGAFACIGLLQHRRSRELARARTRFVANVSHELRTPLAQISMFAETLHLERERSGAERRRFAAIIHAEARRLTTLVENVLRFSRPEHTSTQLRRRPQDVREVLATATRTFAPLAESAGVLIEVDAREELMADVDAAAFHQILLNLLDNAVKHGGRDGRVRLTGRQQEGDVLMTVEDDGPGIPAEERENIFAPFTQIEGRNVAGAGIGLAIVRDLVSAHGGRVWIEESPLGGTRVCVAVARHAGIAETPEGSPEHAVR